MIKLYELRRVSRRIYTNLNKIKSNKLKKSVTQKIYIFQFDKIIQVKEEC